MHLRYVSAYTLSHTYNSNGNTAITSNELLLEYLCTTSTAVQNLQLLKLWSFSPYVQFRLGNPKTAAHVAVDLQCYYKTT